VQVDNNVKSMNEIKRKANNMKSIIYREWSWSWDPKINCTKMIKSSQLRQVERMRF